MLRLLRLCLIAATGLALAAMPARAHDDAEWIASGALRNAAGQWCCGKRDCFVVPDADVRLRRDGYHVTIRLPFQSARIEIVPHAEVQPSPDGRVWRCQQDDGTRRCFFAGPMGT